MRTWQDVEDTRSALMDTLERNIEVEKTRLRFCLAEREAEDETQRRWRRTGRLAEIFRSLSTQT